jgi:RsiW-degrading membrane proteinase PrsW (M82 family)
VPFGLLTVYAVAQVGFVGILDHHGHSPAGWQVFADLVVALLLVLVWLVDDARRLGHNPWPWVVGTLLTGSIAPLLYLATSPARTEDT